jgi:predicted site-specific integrase-resolvase
MSARILSASVVGYVCSEELHDHAGVSPSTVARWRRLGLLPQPTHQSGKRLYWEREAIENALKEIALRRMKPIARVPAMA